MLNQRDQSVQIIPNPKRESPVVIDLTGSPIDLTEYDDELIHDYPASCWNNFIPGVGPVPAESSNWNMSCGTFPMGLFTHRHSVIIPPNGQSRRGSPNMDDFTRETISNRESILNVPSRRPSRHTHAVRKSSIRKAPVRKPLDRHVPAARRQVRPGKTLRMKRAERRQQFMNAKRRSIKTNNNAQKTIKELRAKLKKQEIELKKKAKKKSETTHERKTRTEKKKKRKEKIKKTKNKISEIEKKVKKREAKIEKMNRELEIRLSKKDEKTKKKRTVKKKKPAVEKKKKDVRKKRTNKRNK